MGAVVMTSPDATDKPPAPGSDAAIDAGCKCPVMDNGYGKGFMGIEGYYVIAEGCPVHPTVRDEVEE